MKKISAFLVACALLLSFFCFGAFAVKGQSLEIICSDGGEYLCNVPFSVYYLGSVNGGEIVPDGKFSSYKVSFDVSDSEKMMNLGLTLSAYILRDNIEADYSDLTDEKGVADFEGEVMGEGAYLIMAEKHLQNGNYYFFEPTVVVLPYGESEKLTVIPKYEKVPEETESIKVSYRVLKAWVEDEEGFRPIEIHVQLLCDGEIYDTVVLNSENNWKYQWDNLSSHCHWTVTEKTVEGEYVVSLSREEKAYLLTNSGNIGEKDVEETTKPDKSPDSPDEPATKPEEELPVTGALRWPVPYLAMAGVLLFIIGFVRYRKSEAEDE